MNLYIFLFQCCKATNHAAAVAYNIHIRHARQRCTPKVHANLSKQKI